MRDKNELSKVISHAIRHKPEEYGIKLDQDGWIELKVLIEALKAQSNTFSDLNENDVYSMIEQSIKKRHEVRGQKIRAIYGHSAHVEIEYPEHKPPLNLYHGTSEGNIKSIFVDGLKPMSRQYVHLTSNINEALIVGSRKDKCPVILEIDAYKASLTGLKFYLADKDIWLCKFVPAEYIKKLFKDEA